MVNASDWVNTNPCKMLLTWTCDSLIIASLWIAQLKRKEALGAEYIFKLVLKTVVVAYTSYTTKLTPVHYCASLWVHYHQCIQVSGKDNTPDTDSKEEKGQKWLILQCCSISEKVISKEPDIMETVLFPTRQYRNRDLLELLLKQRSVSLDKRNGWTLWHCTRSARLLSVNSFPIARPHLIQEKRVEAKFTTEFLPKYQCYPKHNDITSRSHG